MRSPPTGFRLATQAADGRGGSPAILQAALGHWHLSDPRELLSVIARHETTAEEIAGFGVRVLELSGRNDASARQVVERAAQALAPSHRRQPSLQKLNLREPPLALGGPMMRITLKRALLEKIRSPLGPVAVVTDPVQGAVANARRLLHPAGRHRLAPTTTAAE